MIHGSGGPLTSVGVGTGGMVRLGNGDGVEGCGVADGPADGTVVCGALVGVAADGVIGWVVRGRIGRGGNSTAVTGVEVVAALVGAAPMLPAPAGCPAVAGSAIGVASIQPIVTATGKPRINSPKKSGLGDNRTP
jgi:hypothetical protein